MTVVNHGGLVSRLVLPLATRGISSLFFRRYMPRTIFMVQLLLFLVIASVCTCLGAVATFQTGSVYKQLNGTFYFVAGPMDEIDGIAYGGFNNTLNVTGTIFPLSSFEMINCMQVGGYYTLQQTINSQIKTKCLLLDILKVCKYVAYIFSIY